MTANPTIFAKAIVGSDAYDEQFATLTRRRPAVEDAYWQLVVDDVAAALGGAAARSSTASGGPTGSSRSRWPPSWRTTPRQPRGRPRAARADRRAEPVREDPGDRRGRAARSEAMIGEGRSINITLDLLARPLRAGHRGVPVRARDLRPSAAATFRVHSVASFFVSRVDTEVDRRLETIGTRRRWRCGVRPAIAQAKLAYRLFRKAHFAGERWERLASPARACNGRCGPPPPPRTPAYPDTLYVDNLIGPDTVNTLPESTIAAFADHGTLGPHHRHRRRRRRRGHAARLDRGGVDMDDVGQTLEVQGIAAFDASVAHVLGTLEAKSGAHALQRALVSSPTAHGDPDRAQASLGEPLVDSAGSNQISEVGADQQADPNICVQSVAEYSGGDVGAHEGG